MGENIAFYAGPVTIASFHIAYFPIRRSLSRLLVVPAERVERVAMPAHRRADGDTLADQQTQWNRQEARLVVNAERHAKPEPAADERAEQREACRPPHLRRLMQERQSQPLKKRWNV